MVGEGLSADGASWIMYAENEATPTLSYYLFCRQLPSRIEFGPSDGGERFSVCFVNSAPENG